MTDTTAGIAAKGLDGTGFTEELAAELFNRVGSHMMAIVDLQVVDRSGPNVKGKRKVQLVIDGIEPATDDNLAEHLRELRRVCHYNRKLDGHTGTTTQGEERTVDDVLAAGAAHRPHPFLPVDASEDNPICDVCGLVQAAGVHSTQDLLEEPDDEDTGADTEDENLEAMADEVDEAPDPDDPAFDPHEYVDTADALCGVCDQPAGSAIHAPFAVPS